MDASGNPTNNIVTPETLSVNEQPVQDINLLNTQSTLQSNNAVETQSVDASGNPTNNIVTPEILSVNEQPVQDINLLNTQSTLQSNNAVETQPMDASGNPSSTFEQPVTNQNVNNNPLNYGVQNSVTTPMDNGVLNNQMPTVNMQPDDNANNNVPPIAPAESSDSNLADDEELLKAFIGKNYDKITTKKFNFSSFFFTSGYMFYRKMLLYGIIFFLANIIIINIFFIKENSSFILLATLVLMILSGLFVNKVYLNYAKKKIEKIKAKNPDKSNEELKIMCTYTGGTSVGQIFLGWLIEFILVIVFIIIMMMIGFGSIFTSFLNLNNTDIKGSGKNLSSNTSGTLLKDVSIDGYTCSNSKCNVIIEDANDNSNEYLLKINNTDLLDMFKEYSDYIKLNIYYDAKTKTINGYKVFLKSNNEDISNVKTEKELRKKIGLYEDGVHTGVFTLIEIDDTEYSVGEDGSYSYADYTFVDDKNIEYEMQSINGALNLIEGNKYNITFEVSKGTFGYEYTIKSINQ